MPKTIVLPPRIEYCASGINITWTKTRSGLCIGGWYDGFVGIESTDMTLREFFDALGITEKDCKKAWAV